MTYFFLIFWMLYKHEKQNWYEGLPSAPLNMPADSEGHEVPIETPSWES